MGKKEKIFLLAIAVLWAVSMIQNSFRVKAGQEVNEINGQLAFARQELIQCIGENSGDASFCEDIMEKEKEIVKKLATAQKNFDDKWGIE